MMWMRRIRVHRPPSALAGFGGWYAFAAMLWLKRFIAVEPEQSKAVFACASCRHRIVEPMR